MFRLCRAHKWGSSTNIMLVLKAGIVPIFDYLESMNEELDKEYDEEIGHGKWKPLNAVELPLIASTSSAPSKALPENFNQAYWQKVNLTEDLRAIILTLKRVAPDLILDSVLIVGGIKISELIVSRGKNIASPIAYIAAISFIISQLEHEGIWNDLSDEEQQRFARYLE